MKEYEQPFFVTFNTNSTHTGVQIPDSKKARFGVDSSVSLKDSLLFLADKELEKFVKNFLKQKIFLPTIFVMMADHTAKNHNSRMDHYRIPFLLYVTDQQKIHKHLPFIASQRDIAPTLLDIIGLEIPNSFSGKSLLSLSEKRFAEYYHNGILGWIQNNRLVETNIFNNKLLYCGQFYKKNRFKEVKCEQGDIEASKLALDFTYYSQEKLFQGKTKFFKPFLY